MAVSVGIGVSVGRGSGVSEGRTRLVGSARPALLPPPQALTRKATINKDNKYFDFLIVELS
jgi:hypothetical protein